jgi:hypothetical protein
MTTTAPHNRHATTTERVLWRAFAWRENPWQLGCTTGHGQKPRERPVAARPQGRLLHESAQAQASLGLPESAPVVSGSEAGRAGFGRHRWLPAPGRPLLGAIPPRLRSIAASVAPSGRDRTSARC